MKKSFKSIANILGMETTLEDEKRFEEAVDDATIDDIRDEEVEEERVEEEIVAEPQKEEVEEKKAEATVSKGQTVLVAPQNYSESKKIANYIKEEKTVMVNLEALDLKEAQRIIDFLSGAAAIKKSKFLPVGRRTYSIIPNGIEVITDGSEGIDNKPLTIEKEA